MNIKNIDISGRLELLVAILFLLSTQFLYISYQWFLPSVYETHYFSALINESDSYDIVRNIYGLIKTPLYSVIDSILISPFEFSIYSYASELLFPVVLFLAIYSITGNILSSLIAIVIFSPLMSLVVMKLTQLSYITSPQTAFGWGSAIFSVRMVFGVISIFTLYFYLKRKYYLFSIFLLFGLLTHPNSGLFLWSIYLLVTLYLYRYGKSIPLRKIVPFAVVMVIGIIPTLLKLKGLDVDANISNFDWYSNMIKDEADDFSLIYQVIYNYKTTIPFLSIVLFTVLLYSRLKNKSDTLKKLLLLMVVPIILFFILLVIELISVYSANMLFITPIISLQPGHKLLSFCFFPMLFMWALIIKDARLIKNNRGLLAIALVFMSISSIGLVFFKGKVSKQIDFMEKIKALEGGASSYAQTLIIKSKLSSMDNPSITDIFSDPENMIINDYFGENNLIKIMKIDERQPILNYDQEYILKYNNITVYEDLIRNIRKNIPEDSGIIIPPYLINMRDSVSDYNLFFQEHHDGNLMMGSKKISYVLLQRMIDLLGVDYKDIPTHSSGYNYTFIRHLYLKLKQEDFTRVNMKYSKYKYVITESSQKLKFLPIYQDEYYNFYRIE